MKFYSLICIRIPNTGSTSVKKTLALIWHAGGKAQIPYVYYRKHKKLDNLMEHGERFFQRPHFLFTFVRNPWDRAVSSYLKGKGLIENDKKQKFRYRSFKMKASCWEFV